MNDKLELLKKVDPALYSRVVRALEAAARQLPEGTIEEIECFVGEALDRAASSGWMAPSVPSSNVRGGRIVLWFWEGQDRRFHTSVAEAITCPGADAPGLLETIQAGRKPRFVAWRKVK